MYRNQFGTSFSDSEINKKFCKVYSYLYLGESAEKNKDCMERDSRIYKFMLARNIRDCHRH
jgi:hypothetical protein